LLHSSLYKQEQPISSITLSINNDLARIDDVGTLPEFQRKGYATHLIKDALSAAKKLNVNYCFLESSTSSFSIYKSLGFEFLFKNNIYTNPAANSKSV
jgi:ribosomal protein S18 acetylase RimI-like enzyme